MEAILVPPKNGISVFWKMISYCLGTLDIVRTTYFITNIKIIITKFKTEKLYVSMLSSWQDRVFVLVEEP